MVYGKLKANARLTHKPWTLTFEQYAALWARHWIGRRTYRLQVCCRDPAIGYVAGNVYIGDKKGRAPEEIRAADKAQYLAGRALTGEAYLEWRDKYPEAARKLARMGRPSRRL